MKIPTVGCEFCIWFSGWDFEKTQHACYCVYHRDKEKTSKRHKLIKTFDSIIEYRYTRDSDINLKPVPIPKWCGGKFFNLNTKVYGHASIREQNILPTHVVQYALR